MGSNHGSFQDRRASSNEKKRASVFGGGGSSGAASKTRRAFFEEDQGRKWGMFQEMAEPKSVPSPLSSRVPDLRGGPDAKKEYSRLVKELVSLGHLTELSRQCLVNYCEAYALACDALDEMRDDGAILESLEKGTKYMHPAYGVWSNARKVMDDEAKNLGMTPKALAELAPAPVKENFTDGPSSFFSRG